MPISARREGASLGANTFSGAQTLTNGNWICGNNAAASTITSGANNFLFGNRAGFALTSASNQIIMGQDAGLSLTTNGGVVAGSPNVYIGYTAGKFSTGGANVAIGVGALGGNAFSATDVYSVAAIGEYALYNLTTGQKETAFGSYALSNLIRGGQNAAFGRAPWLYLAEGSYNLGAGHGAASTIVDSIESIAFGDGALNAYTDAFPHARFIASMSGNVLTVTVISGGSDVIVAGATVVSMTGTALGGGNPIIAAYGTGGTTGSGATGTYQVSLSQTVASQAMASGPKSRYDIAMGAGSGPMHYNSSYTLSLGPNAKTNFDHTTVLGNAQVAATISGDLVRGTTPVTIDNVAGVTWTAVQMRGGQITRSGANAVSDTTPTAAQIVAAIPGCEINSTIEFDVINTNTGLLTILLGSGVIPAGTTTIATVFTRHYRARVTNATLNSEAVTLYGVSTGAN